MEMFKELPQAIVDFTLVASKQPMTAKGLKPHVSDIGAALQLEFGPLLRKIVNTDLPSLFRIGYCTQSGVPVAVINLPQPLVTYLTCHATYTAVMV